MPTNTATNQIVPSCAYTCKPGLAINFGRLGRNFRLIFGLAGFFAAAA